MKIVVISLFILFIMIQFYRPHKNNNKVESPDDFLLVENVPKPIAKILKNSCYDCHSDNTNYRWYDNIAPFSWYIDKKIQRGKLSLNFSKWGSFEPWQRRLFFQGGIIYDIDIKRMPPKSYLLFHPDAKISQKEKKMIAEWIGTIDLTKE